VLIMFNYTAGESFKGFKPITNFLFAYLHSLMACEASTRWDTLARA
jgi:hypothetical protein